MFNHYSYSKLPIVTVWFGKRAILFDGIKWRHRRTAYGPCWQTPRPSGYGKLGQAIRQWIWSTPLLILMEFYGNSWFFNVYSNGNKGEGMRKPFLTKLTHKLTETEMWYNCDRVTSCFLFIIPQLSPTRNEWQIPPGASGEMRQLERQGASLSFRRAGSSKAMAENWDIPVAPMDWKKLWKPPNGLFWWV